MTALLPTHGVLIQFENTGIYLIGNSGVGKSETALQLIHQGAVLICDDAPELTPGPDNTQLLGTCPQGFYGMMHLRDLGIINIIELLGKHCFNSSHAIDFVIELKPAGTIVADGSEQNSTLLEPQYQYWHFQHWTIPGIRLHLYPNSNAPLIIKTAVMQFNNNKNKFRASKQ